MLCPIPMRPSTFECNPLEKTNFAAIVLPATLSPGCIATITLACCKQYLTLGIGIPGI
jgi:hypothetical protein